MTWRQGWRLLWFVCLGCQSLLPVEPVGGGKVAKQLWEKGQMAMRRGRPQEAIPCYQQSLAADATLVRNHLSLAAAYLEQGDEAGACPHLAAYVQAHPDHRVIRARYAELLLRQRRLAEAHAEFTRYVTDAQDAEGLTAPHLIHCQSRLMDIAEAQGDVYSEHLHRGIGLYLVGRKRRLLPNPEGELPVEALLCRAAGELTLARLQRPEEARPCWYLYEVWSRLAQRPAALRWLREADAAAPFSYLTPAEQRGLHWAHQRYLMVSREPRASVAAGPLTALAQP